MKNNIRYIPGAVSISGSTGVAIASSNNNINLGKSKLNDKIISNNSLGG